MCLKAPKIQKHVKKLRIDGWEFLDTYLQGKGGKPEDSKDDHGVEPSEKFIQNILAGRPVLCPPSRPGGFRLRYGRTRATGLAALAIHPATMRILDDFIAVGTQIKTERPGKAGAVTPCDRLEGPIVVLDTGDRAEIADATIAVTLAPRVRVIADLGEILVPFGEFLENNHVLMPGAFATEWYGVLLAAKLGSRPPGWEAADAAPAPARYNLFWHALTVEEIRTLREAVAARGRLEEGRLVLPRDESLKEVLVRLGATHRVRDGGGGLDRHTEAVLACLGIDTSTGGLAARGAPAAGDPPAVVSAPARL